MVDSFKDYHPLVNFSYLAFVIVFNMLVLNPVLQIVSLLVGLLYNYILREGRMTRRTLIYGLFILLFSPVFNSLFNHKGETILFYLNTGNPITLESIFYGLASGLMFVNMLVWFSCYNKLMTSDKFLHIFGNIIPSLSLIISMILRFVPSYIERLGEIYRAQKGIGEYEEGSNIIERGKNGLKLLSIMVTWALENSIDSSDSMRARGYGLARRTSFTNYRLTRRDLLALLAMLVLFIFVVRGVYLGAFEIVFFPGIVIDSLSMENAYQYVIFTILVLTPIILNIVEEVRWRYLKSKI